jgi:hypothetical protein
MMEMIKPDIEALGVQERVLLFCLLVARGRSDGGGTEESNRILPVPIGVAS